MKTRDIQGILVGQVIVGIIASILLLFDDFAGWYHYDYYNKIRQWGYIYFGSGFLTTIIMIGVLTLLLVPVYKAYKMLKQKKTEKKTLSKYVLDLRKFGTILVAIAAIGAVIFAVSNIIDQTGEWWLDTSFYSTLIAGGLYVLFAKLIEQKN